MQSCFPGVLSALTIGLLVGACSGSDKSDSAPAAQTAAVVDPAPEFEVPGDQDVISDTVDDGEYYIVSDDGLAAVGGIIPTANNGSFSFEAPLFCGVQIVKCVWSNDVGSYVLVTEVTREDCTDADIQITLGWDDLGQDYELHLVKPGGRINDNATDCTWTSCINQGPDWGVQGDTGQRISFSAGPKKALSTCLLSIGVMARQNRTGRSLSTLPALPRLRRLLIFRHVMSGMSARLNGHPVKSPWMAA